jgi:hypothetical protein
MSGQILRRAEVVFEALRGDDNADDWAAGLSLRPFDTSIAACPIHPRHHQQYEDSLRVSGARGKADEKLQTWKATSESYLS